jgi:GNAT superfamily N-acetyltransferase
MVVILMRRDAIMGDQQFYITNTRRKHIPGVLEILRSMYADSHPEYVNYLTEHNLREQINKFPEGQFVAVMDGQVVAFAVTMRTGYSPTSKPQSWRDAVGDENLRKHNPRGEWLYGVDFAVHPDYRRHGIGTAMYSARFALVKRLGLKGFYAGGMLRGYEKYSASMSVREYGERVMRGEITDPTVSMQMKRGFVPYAVIDYYDDFAPSGDSAMLIVWHNPLLRRQVAAAGTTGDRPRVAAAPRL